MTRPGLDAYFLDLARLVATRSTCLRRAVGCVLVDEVGHLLSTGYNGVPRGFPHCNERVATEYDDATDAQLDKLDLINACVDARAPSGTALASCRAVHAEQNALLQCPDVDRIRTCYVTVTPCVTCLKLLLNTNCQRIVATEYYARGTEHDELLINWWARYGREIVVTP